MYIRKAPCCFKILKIKKKQKLGVHAKNFDVHQRNLQGASSKKHAQIATHQARNVTRILIPLKIHARREKSSGTSFLSDKSPVRFKFPF